MKNFIDLTDEEKEMVLNWRNHPRIRENMYSSDEISLQEHLSFIENLKGDVKNRYFLVGDIGIIYFNNIHKDFVEIGLYSNPKKYGVGNFLIEKILEYNFRTLYLEVIETNKKAIDLYLRYGFKIKEKKIKKDKMIICMELRR